MEEELRRRRNKEKKTRQYTPFFAYMGFPRVRILAFMQITWEKKVCAFWFCSNIQEHVNNGHFEK